MILPECQEQFDWLMRFFGWLLEEYDYVVIHSTNGYMDSCGFTLQSGDCRLFMARDRGSFGEFELTMLPASQRLEGTPSGWRWYHVAKIIDYLRGWYLSWPQIEERNRSWSNLSEDELLMQRAKEWRSFWPQIMRLFQEDEFKRRQEELEVFIQGMDEDLHKQVMVIERHREVERIKRYQSLQNPQELEECLREMEEKTGEAFRETQEKWLELIQKEWKKLRQNPQYQQELEEFERKIDEEVEQAQAKRLELDKKANKYQ